MLRALGVISILSLAGCGGDGWFSLKCSEAESYTVSIDTSESPVVFSWEGSDAKFVAVRDGDDTETLWDITFPDSTAVEAMDEINSIASPVTYGEAEESETLEIATEPVDLVSGEDYIVVVDWGCKAGNGNSGRDLRTPFTAP